MKFVVVDIAASSGGALTILKELYNSVKDNKEHKWYFLLNDNYIEETDNCKIVLLPCVKRSKFKRLLFDLFSGKRIIRKYNPDLVINLQNTHISGIKVPTIIYQDQPLPFQSTRNFSFFKKEERKLAIYQHILKHQIFKATRKADAVIVQTKWMKDAVIKKCKVVNEKIHILPPNVRIPNILENKEYSYNQFFYPASAAYYKNHQCIYDAASILAEKNFNFDIFLTINGKDKNNLHFLGNMDHKDVIERMAYTTLVFPSYIETFGLPLVEARMLGSLILAADTEFSRELLSGYPNAYYFDYDDSEELANLMKKVISGDIVREKIDEGKQIYNDTWKKFLEICLSCVVK